MHEKLNIRPADRDDIKKIFDLSNDPAVRKASFNSAPIIWEEHCAWFERQLSSRNSYFYIVEDNEKNFIAQVRFSTADSENKISISMSPDFRSKGLAGEIIRKTSLKTGLRCIAAYIKPDNIPSLKSFIKAGYKITEKNSSWVKAVYTRPVYIIAEMSANHCGNFELAKEIIKAAKEAGADAVKTQTYTADTITINCDNEEFRINDKNSLWNGENLYSLYQKAYTPWEWQGKLKKYADEIGIDFFSTPFDFTAVDFLENINVPMYKIASFEAIDYPLIKYAARLGKPMIISTGISSLKEIEKAVEICRAAGNNDITLLKCTSAYPAKIEDMNLITIKDMISRFGPFGVKAGLSDHSMSIVPPIAAVAMGAAVIEKHFTLDRALGGADSGFSLNKKEFAEMAQAVRDTEKSLGTANYDINWQNRKFARSLYVVKDIKAGEKFTAENVRSIRPSDGLHPEYYEQIIGKTAKKDYKFATPLTLKDIK